VAEIENAGILEVLQTPGAGPSSWAILDNLVAQTGSGSLFQFREPLGQAREVKVALSGLFGRFVARAYLSRYFGLGLFGHIGKSPLLLHLRLRAKVQRKGRGDLPDWLSCRRDLTALTIAEAKGCHEAGGPKSTLRRAWAQANRVDVTINGRRPSLKRIAVVTRWGIYNGSPARPIIAVRDPEEAGQEIPPEEESAAAIGLARIHVANLLTPLGYGELANMLRNLIRAPSARATDRIANDAFVMLSEIPGRRIGLDGEGVGPNGDTIGGFVARVGPLPNNLLTPLEQQALSQLDIRAAYVGLERRFIKGVIKGDAELIREATSKPFERTSDSVRTDGSGSWIVRLSPQIAIQ
jgi:hypothetical protein